MSGGAENPAFISDDPTISRQRSGRGYSEETMETIDLRRSPPREDRLQLQDREETPHGAIVEADVTDSDFSPRCGICFFRPACLQRFRTPKWVLFWLCWASAVQGMVVNGFVNVVITTIERRYSLRSSESGLVAGGYDVASFLCLIPVSYYGGRESASKPRWIGLGVLVMAFGSLLFALPQFTVSAYRGIHLEPDVCHVNRSYQESCDSNTPSGYLSVNLWLFVISQLLTGAGAAPLYTLGVTYLDENVTKKMSSVYLGIYYTASLVGPALGYLIGGEMLKVYTDFLTNDPNEFGLTPSSSVWVGAWWVGFVLAAVVCTLIAIPIIALPPSLPGSLAIRKEKTSEAHGNSHFQSFGKLREIPRALGQLIVNPTFSFLSMAGASEGFLISGFAAFMPKLVENEFSISASFAAILMGAITVPAGGGGTFLGGYLVKKLGLKCAGIIKLCVWSSVICMLFVCCFLLSCPNLRFAGLNTPYVDSTKLSLEDTCNYNCRCGLNEYDPVCGIDGVVYYSPCHAGCMQETLLLGNKVYSDCACIQRPINDIPTAFQGLPGSNSTWSAYDAQNITCESSCGYLWLFVVLAFCVMVCTFLATMPALSATLRCVRDEQRSFALGIQWLVVRIFGTIPSPLLFGLVIDRTCILWEKNTCDDGGSCHVYDNYYMSRYMLGIASIGKACSLLFYFCAWWFYVPPADSTKPTPMAPIGAVNANFDL